MRHTQAGAQVNNPQPFIPMRVAATGICCSVGNNTASASAAIRADMSHFRSGNFYDEAGEPIKLAMLYEVPLWGQPRLQHMYRAAMIECLGSLPSIAEAERLPPIILIGSERERGPRFQHSITDLLNWRGLRSLDACLDRRRNDSLSPG